MKKFSKKQVCAYTGLPSTVTLEYEIEKIKNGTSVVVPLSIKCSYRDMVSQKISGEGFSCYCDNEVKRIIEDKFIKI